MAAFEFNQQLIPQSVIDIDNIGEFAIEGINDDGYFYYLIIKTTLGTATIVSSGPSVPDVALLPDGYKCELTRMQYKEDKLAKAINMWLNDRSKKLTSARIISIDEAIDEIRDLREYMLNYSEEIY